MLPLTLLLFRRCLWVFFVSCCLKALLASPSTYASTDFDVHRNWLAITQNLPPSRWYHDETSMWTLDYPPAFAYFEWSLSHVAAVAVGYDALQLAANAVRTWPIVLFQRASVIASELPLFVALCALVAARLRLPASVRAQLTRFGGLRSAQSSDKNGSAAAEAWLTAATRTCSTTSALVLLHSGLVLVDNVHFQYNGYLLSMLVGGLAAAYAGRPLLGVLLLALLALHKHLFAVLAPAAAVYLAAAAVPHTRGTSFSVAAVAVVRRLAIAVALVAALSLLVIAPVLVEDWSGAAAAAASPGVWATAVANVRAGHAAAQISVGGQSTGSSSDGSSSRAVLAAEAIVRNGLQLLSRLFPFSRGLVHAYWAPNAWAAYMACDKIAAAVAKRLGVGLPLPLPLLGSRAAGLAGTDAGSDALLPVPGHAHLPHAVNSSSFLIALPSPTPLVCGCITLVLLLPALWRLWRGCLPLTGSRTGAMQSESVEGRQHAAARHLHIAIVLSYGVAFAFGWHAHEKAALYVALPLLLLAADPGAAVAVAVAEAEAAGNADDYHDAGAAQSAGSGPGGAGTSVDAGSVGAGHHDDGSRPAAPADSVLRRRPGVHRSLPTDSDWDRHRDRQAAFALPPAATAAAASKVHLAAQPPSHDVARFALPIGTAAASAWAIHLSASVAVLPLIFTSLEVPFVLLHALAYSLWLREQLPGLSKANVFWRVLLPAGLCAAALLHTFCLPGTAAVCVRFPFLPLAAVSLACAVGMLSATASLYISWLRSSD